jgi:hypothetical protein
LGLRAIEIDSHRHPLHDLYVVSGRVFRGQQAEHGTGPAPEVGYVCFPATAVRIDLYLDWLTGFHVLKLRFFEVGRHPDIVEGNDVHEFLSDAHVLADFGSFPPNNSVHGRADHGIAETEFSLIQLGLALIYLCLGSVGFGTDHGNLLRSSLGTA